jgi:hypothetical protein
MGERDHAEQPRALPAPATQIAEGLLARLDRALPGRIEGFYVVGSACMGAFRLGAVHLGRWMSALVRDVAVRRRWSFEVTPLAGHVSGRFRIAERDGFDVNPITWQVLARHGIARAAVTANGWASVSTRRSFGPGRIETTTATGGAGSSAPGGPAPTGPRYWARRPSGTAAPAPPRAAPARRGRVRVGRDRCRQQARRRHETRMSDMMRA